MVLSPYPVHLNPTGFAPLPCATEVCVLLLLLVDSLESKKLGRSCFLSSLPLASSWFGNPRRRRSRRRRSRRRSPIQVCNDVVKENQMAMP